MVEDIGIYSSLPLKPLLEPLFQGHAYQFTSHNNIEHLQCWLLSTRPQLIIFESKFLAESSPPDLESLKETLQKWGVISLILANSIEEIQMWRERKWPAVQFFRGPPSGRSLKKKMVNLLKERLLLERPRVAVFSEKPYLLSHLESVMRNYGVSMIPIPQTDSKEMLVSLACEHSDVLLWDITFMDKTGEKLYADLRNCPLSSQLPVYLISEEKDPSVTHWWKKTDVDPHIYHADKVGDLVSRISETIFKNRRIKLRECRDQRTGLYLRDTFLAIAEREISLSGRSGQEFSVIKLSMGNLNKAKEKFGSIFAQELEMNLGLFIQNRVRSSDFVAKGKSGEILVLFPRLDRHLATLVGERLRQSFSKAATFQDGTSHQFDPQLHYEIYCYPHDVQNLEELEQAVEGTGIFAKPHRPSRVLKVNLSEEL